MEKTVTAVHELHLDKQETLKRLVASWDGLEAGLVAGLVVIDSRYGWLASCCS
jgi:hypothetical protein